MVHIPENSRIPSSCPANFQGRYTVVRGDTLFRIAQFFRTTVGALIAANPHIINPSLIFPGDVLCVPGQVAFPCCIVLRPATDVPTGTIGAALAHISPQGTQAISVVATLPPPQRFGDFDIYITTVLIPNINGFGTQLFPTREDPPTWASRIDLPTAATLLPDSTVLVRPSNSITGVDGPIILEGTLRQCRM